MWLRMYRVCTAYVAVAVAVAVPVPVVLAVVVVDKRGVASES